MEDMVVLKVVVLSSFPLLIIVFIILIFVSLGVLKRISVLFNQLVGNCSGSRGGFQRCASGSILTRVQFNFYPVADTCFSNQ